MLKTDPWRPRVIFNHVHFQDMFLLGFSKWMLISTQVRWQAMNTLHCQASVMLWRNVFQTGLPSWKTPLHCRIKHLPMHTGLKDKVKLPTSTLRFGVSWLENFRRRGSWNYVFWRSKEMEDMIYI